VCAYHEWNLDGLVEMCWEYLDLVRVYTKPKGKLPDFNEPVVLHRSHCMIEDFCNKIHKTMVKQLKYAHVWGTSVKHRPQKVGKDHELQVGDGSSWKGAGGGWRAWRGPGRSLLPH
jgi:ribosome-interacting GTPase 1